MQYLSPSVARQVIWEFSYFQFFRNLNVLEPNPTTLRRSCQDIWGTLLLTFPEREPLASRDKIIVPKSYSLLSCAIFKKKIYACDCTYRHINSQFSQVLVACSIFCKKHSLTPRNNDPYVSLSLVFC